MPSARNTATAFGSAVRCCSSFAIVCCGVSWTDAHPAASASETQALNTRRFVIRWLLQVGIEHVFESQPLGIEVEVDVPRSPVTILSHQQLSRAGDVARPVI